jgi:O-antigen ligase
MLGSRSATAVVGVITAYIALFFADRLKNKRFGFRAGLMAIGLVVITLCAVEIGFEPQDALNVLGRDTTLTGRTQIWSTAIQYIGDRPLLGYGYQVFWEPDGPVRRYLAKDLGWEPVTAHNGYLEIGLDFGLVGLLLFSIFLCEAVRRSITYLRTSSESVRAWPFVVIIGLAAMNFADANVVLYNEFLWVIFMIAFLYATVDDLNLSATNRHEFENVAVPLASNG